MKNKGRSRSAMFKESGV